MTEETQEEVEKLRAKNQELLDEKKRAKQKADELAEQVEQLTQERDKLAADLHRATVEQPRLQTVEQIAEEGMAKPLLREIEDNFDIGDSGELYSKDGEPILNGEEPVKLDQQGIIHLQQNGMIPAAMIRRSRGSGARGMSRTVEPMKDEEKQRAKPRKFGIR